MVKSLALGISKPSPLPGEGGSQKRCRICDPKICPFGMWITLNWRRSRLCRLKLLHLPELPKRIQMWGLVQEESCCPRWHVSYLYGRANITYLGSICSSCVLSCGYSQPLWNPRTLSRSLAWGGMWASATWLVPGSHFYGAPVCKELTFFSC